MMISSVCFCVIWATCGDQSFSKRFGPKRTAKSVTETPHAETRISERPCAQIKNLSFRRMHSPNHFCVKRGTLFMGKRFRRKYRNVADVPMNAWTTTVRKRHWGTTLFVLRPHTFDERGPKLVLPTGTSFGAKTIALD